MAECTAEITAAGRLREKNDQENEIQMDDSINFGLQLQNTDHTGNPIHVRIRGSDTTFTSLTKCCIFTSANRRS